MSSFVVSKINYVRAAAFLSAAAEHQNYYGEPVLSLWNQQTCRRYTSDDIRADFERLYEINAAAVALQYGDPQPESDPVSYFEEFAEAKGKAAHLFNRGYTFERETDCKLLKHNTYGLIQFFDSVRYQIEDKDNTRRALRIMNKYYRGLYSILIKLDGIGSDEQQAYWGSFDVE